MSATGRSAAAGTGYVRHPDDYFATPAWCTRAILPFVVGTPTRILEPCCGEGAILREVHARWPHASLEGIEIDEGRATQTRLWLPEADVSCDDFLSDGVACSFDDEDENGRSDLIITNPPFNLAMEFVQRSLEVVRPGGTVLMLLRLNWLESQNRAKWLRAHTPSVFVLPRRPSFTGKGTDATGYAWMRWCDEVCVGSTIRILDVEARS